MYFANYFWSHFAAAPWTVFVFGVSAEPPHPSYAPGKRMPDRRQTSLLSCDLKQEKVEHQLQVRHETSLSLTDRTIKTDACFASSQNTN
jgi:hypothetical protein